MSRTTSATWAACVKVGRSTTGSDPSLDPHRLRVDERLRAEARELAAVARVLGAAERDLRRRGRDLVDVHHAGLDLVDQPLRLARVLGPGATAEAEARVVGDGDRLVEVLRAEEQRHRTEELLVVRRGVLRDVGERRRRVEVALAPHRLAAGEELRARGHRVLHLLVELLEALRS